jgi:hypothetical protein
MVFDDFVLSESHRGRSGVQFKGSKLKGRKIDENKAGNQA